jgi:hypothetical protein
MLLDHLLLSGLIISSIYAVELLFHHLWHDHQPMLYGQFPLKWIFDTIDIGVLAVFGFWGIYEANEQMRGP